jgi:IS5 family transposase
VLFAALNSQLEAKGLIVKQGTLVDASFMASPARPPAKPKAGQEARPSADPKAGQEARPSADPKAGQEARSSADPKAGEKARPSADPDARWGRKGKKSVFGYKIHTGVDAGHTLIRRVELTPASLNDTEPADQLISGDEKALYATWPITLMPDMPGWRRRV